MQINELRIINDNIRVIRVPIRKLESLIRNINFTLFTRKNQA